jgi:transcription antitermination protein NusB
MLSRRHLRIKVMQTLYSYSHAGFDSLSAGENELLLSINHYYELFLYQLSFLAEVLETARRQHEDSKQKHLREAEEINPTRFIDNRLLNALSENKTLNELYKKRNISWISENEIVRRLLKNFKNRTDYKKYMAAEKNDFEMDKGVVVSMIKKSIDNFPQLMQFYESKSIFWVDDVEIVNFILCKIIWSFKEDEVDKVFSGLELSLDDEDREFTINLFRKTVMSAEKLEKIISERTVNWEVDRIAVMDIILLKMAICELMEFPSIPVKVTMNEYIDIAKMYSTPKSGVFINGILDKLLADFRLAGLIKKTGRGLMQ